MRIIKRRYFRYALYAVEIFILYIIEGTPYLIPEIALAKPMLLVSAAVSAAAFELPCFSLFFGVFCGLVIDVGTGGVMGLTSILLGGICYCVSAWNNKYIKNNIYLVLLYSAVAAIAVVSLKFFIFCFIKPYSSPLDDYITHYLPRMVYTWAATPIIYVITMCVSITYRKDKRKAHVKKRKRVPHSQRSAVSRRRAKLNNT
ncbi:MAG: hypothetical protein II589_05330 [Clostridia bacterium]|nr:hypothetical protein [Clostridia bacterium]